MDRLFDKIALRILSCIAALFCSVPAMRGAGEIYISGLGRPVIFSEASAETGGASRTSAFSTGGTLFKSVIIRNNSSGLLAVENSVTGEKEILFSDGRPAYAASSLPRIGFVDSKEKKSNVYTLGTHDFTNDGRDELVLCVTDSETSGLGVFIFEYNGRWQLIGQMLTIGKDISECRIFKQTLTMKNGQTGVLYSWTWHGDRFDFLSSDKENDYTVLY